MTNAVILLRHTVTHFTNAKTVNGTYTLRETDVIYNGIKCDVVAVKSSGIVSHPPPFAIIITNIYIVWARPT